MLNFFVHVVRAEGKDNATTSPLETSVADVSCSLDPSVRPAASDGRCVDVHTSARLLVAATQTCQEAWPAGATGGGDSLGFEYVIQIQEAIADSTRRFKKATGKNAPRANPYPWRSPIPARPPQQPRSKRRNGLSPSGGQQTPPDGQRHTFRRVALEILQHATCGLISDIVQLRSIWTSTLLLCGGQVGGQVRKADKPALWRENVASRRQTAPAATTE